MSETQAAAPTPQVLADGRAIVVRPVRATDETAVRAFFERLSPGTRRLRFHQETDVIDPGLMRFYTHVDPQHHLAFVCEHAGEIVGEARCVAHPGGGSCELGIAVADDWRHTGIAQMLMDALIDAARRQGLRSIEGLVLRENSDMLDFVKAFGFETLSTPEKTTTLRVVKRL